MKMIDGVVHLMVFKKQRQRQDRSPKMVLGAQINLQCHGHLRVDYI